MTSRRWTKTLAPLVLAVIPWACTVQTGEVNTFTPNTTDNSTDPVKGWKCDTSGGGTQVSPQGRYYVTNFGCWLDDNGKHRGDGADNCVPYCIDTVCTGLSGRACEEQIKWYTAGARRYGCGARLRMTNPENHKSVVVMVIDKGPNCSIEKRVKHWVMDLSTPTIFYLFGSEMSAEEKGLVLVEEVEGSTPLGPVDSEPEPIEDPQ